MAKGKHGRAKTNRDRKALETRIAELQREIEAELRLRDAAEELEAAAAALADRYDTAVAERDRRLQPQRDQLERQIALLSPLVEEAESYHEKIREVWQDLLDGVAPMVSTRGGVSRLEMLMQVLGQGGHLVDSDSQRRLGTDAALRIQLAQGFRKSIPDIAAPKAHPTQLIKMLSHADRTIYERAQTEAGVENEANGRSDRSDDTVRDMRQRLAVLAHTRVTTYTADAIRALHPLPWVRLPELGETHELLTELGAECESSGSTHRADDLTQIKITPALPAAARERIAEHSPLEVAEVFGNLFHRDSIVVEALGRLDKPWLPAPVFPVPGDALSIKHWYGLAALGAWLRRYDAGARSAQDGRVAVGLRAAVPLWLPTGQVANFIDSEPLPAEDIPEIRLPYPQVLLCLADPIVLPALVDDPDVAKVTHALEAVMYDFAKRNNQDALGMARAVGERDLPTEITSVHHLLSAVGGRIEAILLLGDSLGRLEDTFAWCIALPSANGKVLGRFVIRASRARTRWTHEIECLAAVAAWADWHGPDKRLAPDENSSKKDLEKLTKSPGFKSAARQGGMADVHVLNVKRTHSDGAAKGGEATVRPHARRGHWRRQRHGVGNSLVKWRRVAPTLVNAGRGDLAPTVYRLPAGSAAYQPAIVQQRSRAEASTVDADI